MSTDKCTCGRLPIVCEWCAGRIKEIYGKEREDNGPAESDSPQAK